MRHFNLLYYAISAMNKPSCFGITAPNILILAAHSCENAPKNIISISRPKHRLFTNLTVKMFYTTQYLPSLLVNCACSVIQPRQQASALRVPCSALPLCQSPGVIYGYLWPCRLGRFSSLATLRFVCAPAENFSA